MSISSVAWASPDVELPFPVAPARSENPERATKKRLAFASLYGADDRIRTGDLILTKDALYLLSYISTLSFDNSDTISQVLKKSKHKFLLFCFFHRFFPVM